MAKTVIIRIGFFGLSTPEINLFKTILKSSSRLAGEWRIDNKGIFNVIIFNPLDSEPQLDQLAVNGIAIPIHRRNEKPNSLHILKPYRADEIVDTLNGVLVSLATKDKQTCNNTAKSSKRYKLKSWPKQHILDVDKRYLHLATYLTRRPLTHNELISISNQPDELCKRFIGLLLKEGLIDIVSKKPSAPRSKMGKNNTFFGLLKSRLGFGKGQ